MAKDTSKAIPQHKRLAMGEKPDTGAGKGASVPKTPA